MRLPLEMQAYIAVKLRVILEGNDKDEKFDHLSREDRQAIAEILRETKPEFWKLAEKP